jgi:hypothetical protein
MLLAALGATIVGFALLVAALITAKVWLAIACVVVSVVGVLLLLGDVLTYRRNGTNGGNDGARRTPATAPTKRSDDGADRATGSAPASGVAALGAPTTDDVEAGDDGDDCVAVGQEAFGHHTGDPAPPADLVADLHRARIVDWTHESAADTDDEAERRLYVGETDEESGSAGDEHGEDEYDEFAEVEADPYDEKRHTRALQGKPLYDPDLTDLIPPIKDDDPDPRKK